MLKWQQKQQKNWPLKGEKYSRENLSSFFSRRQYNKGMTSFFMYLKNPFGVWHRIAYDEAGKSDIGSRLWKNDGLRHLDVRLASEILGIHVLPKFVGQPFWFRARGRIRIEATKYHPIPEVLQVTITVPWIRMQLEKFSRFSPENHFGLKKWNKELNDLQTLYQSKG